MEFVPSIREKHGKERVGYSPSAGMEGFRPHRPSDKLNEDLIHHRKKYDVYLNFRGPDVRTTLANKLFKSLQHEGLHVFLDSERLETGDDIAMRIEEAIKESRVFIAIFSRGYASSAWCLKELSLMRACMVKCAETRIIPLFYDVEPWEVGCPDREGSTYAEAFKMHSLKGRHTPEEIEDWKKALQEVSLLSGWVLPHTASGGDPVSTLVERIGRDIKLLGANFYNDLVEVIDASFEDGGNIESLRRDVNPVVVRVEDAGNVKDLKGNGNAVAAGNANTVETGNFKFEVQGVYLISVHQRVPERLVAEKPVVEAAIGEEPVAEAAVAKKPVAEAVAEEPVAEAAVAKKPVAEAIAEEPVVEEEPIAEAAVAEETVAEEEPVAEAAVAEESVVEAPVAEEPVAEVAVAKKPVAEEEAVAEETVAKEEPVAEAAVAKEPVAAVALAEEAVAKEPVVEVALAEEPVAEAVAEEPVAEKPIAEEEAVAEEEPVTEAAVAKKPVVEAAAEEAVKEKPVAEAATPQLVPQNIKVNFLRSRL